MYINIVGRAFVCSLGPCGPGPRQLPVSCSPGLVGPLSHCGPGPCAPSRGLVGRALVAPGLLGPLWVPLGTCGLGPCGLPWALVGRALVGLPLGRPGPCVPVPLWAGPWWAFLGLCGPPGPGLNGLPRMYIYIYIHVHIYIHVKGMCYKKATLVGKISR